MKFFSHGVLGMNARNLKYIRTKNTGKSVSLADSKLKTKNFLSGRGIPFAQTYAVISSGSELSNFSFDSIPENNFVIKPNHGSKGQGILIVKKGKHNNFIISGKNWTEDEVRLHMIDTLGGAFSLYGSHDSVVIEELLMPGKDFSKFCRHGLADIRMIVYNYVPITAMVRMPTELSGGKANLAQWGIGLGLNVSTGEVMSFYQHKKNYTASFPSPYKYLQGAKIPFWDDILLYSSQIQFYTGLGYLALDWVITKSGPKLLEINARAGLEIQNVNLVPLAKRLKQVDNLKIRTPEKGVEIAKTLFNSDVSTMVGGKKMIFALQKIHFRGTDIIVKVDPLEQKTLFSPDLKKKFSKNTTIIFDNSVEMELLPAENFTENSLKNTIILGQENLKNYLIVPEISPNFQNNVSGKFSEKIMKIDERLFQIGKKVSFNFLSKPTNYTSELEKFLEAPYQYNPIFEYKFPHENEIIEIKESLENVQSEINSLGESEFIFKKIFSEKLSELSDQLLLIIAYKDENFEEIHRLNEKLFGGFDEKLLKIATSKVLDNAQIDAKKQEKLLGPVLSNEEIIAQTKEYLQKNNIADIEIRLSETTLSRMAVAYKWNEVYLNLGINVNNVKIRKNELPAILAHEVGTHFRRYLGGVQAGLKIFSYGTANYLTDEEGLAIYNSLEFVLEWYEKNAMYLNYYTISQADTLSFTQTTKLLQSLHPDLPLQKIFRKAFRLKRGIIHTKTENIHGTTYQKDKIYLDGYYRIKKWVDDGGDIDLLYFWKVKISDLPFIAKL